MAAVSSAATGKSQASLGRILVVEDDDSLRFVMHAQLQRSGYATSVAASVSQALDLLRKEPTDLVISDLCLPDSTGLELLKTVRAEYPETMVIIVTAFATVATAVEAIKFGAYDYLIKPVYPDEVEAVVRRAFERQRLIEEVRVLRSAVDRKYGFENIIGSSNALLQVLNTAASVAHTDATVLILGETGTGKELLAKAIHFNSGRRDAPFVVISCGSIPRDLLESELFGHLKGSFTGALTHKKGRVEIADGGTVFLDEIGDMPLELQVRVLRLVQEHEIEKIGAIQPQKVNVRIIAATHRNLETRVAEGSFREDLYYRLSVVPIELPPLRDRQGDISLLVEEFFDRARQKHEKSKLRLPPELMPFFLRHRWPGNVRELQNVVERIVVMCASNEVTLSDLPAILRVEDRAQADPKVETDGMSLYEVEREMIVQALRKFGWNQAKTARYLSITRKTLMYRIAKHGIEKEVPTRPEGSANPDRTWPKRL